MFWITCQLLAGTTLCTGAAAADVLLEQPVDFQNYWASFYRPSGVQFGDDFAPQEPVVIESVTFWMIGTWPNAPWMWSFTVHRGYLEHPIYDFAPFIEHFYRMFNPSSVIDLGPWPNPRRRDYEADYQMHLFEVRFDNVGLRLDSGVGDLGVYWFSGAGHLRDYPRDLAWWATAGNGEINGDMGYYKDEPRDWPGWSRMSRAGYSPSDFAMRIEGVPADEYQPTTELLDFEVVTGDFIDGNLDDLQEAGDDEVVTVHSRAAIRDGEQYYAMTVITRHKCLIESPDVLDVSVTADVQRIFQVPDAIIWLRNWTTGEFDEVGRYDIYVERVTWPFRGIEAEQYLNEENEIELRFEVRAGPLTHPQERMNYFFISHIDRIKIDARHEE